MAFYPVHKELQNLSRHMQEGNFCLWYNKFIPLNNANACKPSDDKDDKDSENRAVDHYFYMYGKMKNNADGMLKRKHADMDDFCASFPPDTYEEIVICATLMTPLITGIGESHPHEVSMVFDHNMGIPYIPASGVKGIVRFAHTLSLLLDDDGQIREEYKDKEFIDESDTDIPDIFGGEKKAGKDKKDLFRGKVVFLDAYPKKVPDLHIDIMNPHYAPYYSEGKPPADHYNPTPIKFLTVAKGTSFIFRAVAEKKDNMSERVETAFRKALTEEGVGAKTAVGYGRFKIEKRNLKNESTAREHQEQTLFVVAPEEIWDDAYVSFNAGGGGIVTAMAKDGKKAELRGKDKVLAATAESLHKKLFERKRNIPRARVTVRKTGNSYEIVNVKPVTS